MTTVERLLQSVFAGKKFESGHHKIDDADIFSTLSRLPFSLSKSQRTAIYRALKMIYHIFRVHLYWKVIHNFCTCNSSK